MVFSDPIFLFAFLPASLVLYWLGAWRFRNVFLVGIGGIFYAWGGGALVYLLAGSIVANHVAARVIAKHRETRPELARWMKRVIVTADLTALVLWKYAGFGVAQISRILHGLGIASTWSLNIALPIAISFFTFQSISYVVDVWRGDARPAPRLVDYASYILLFPHLIAGPIVRYSHIEHDLLNTPRHRFDDFARGAPRFFWGLTKKILIADQVAAIADAAFGTSTGELTTGVAWAGMIAYTVQIYFDFSGYSDMAIGLARMFGFDFPENFNHPYSARSVTDFWRRWHISLSSWFRDYVYIPLGGNRRGVRRTYINLAIVFLLTGVWHGAAWTFVAWGIFHGSLLVFERVSGLAHASDKPLSICVRRIFTMVAVGVGWIIFRSPDLATAARHIAALTPAYWGAMPPGLDQMLSRQRMTWLIVGLSVVVLPARQSLGSIVSAGKGMRADAARLAVVAVLGPICLMYALSGSFSPFLYFQF